MSCSLRTWFLRAVMRSAELQPNLLCRPVQHHVIHPFRLYLFTSWRKNTFIGWCSSRGFYEALKKSQKRRFLPRNTSSSLSANPLYWLLKVPFGCHHQVNLIHSKCLSAEFQDLCMRQCNRTYVVGVLRPKSRKPSRAQAPAARQGRPVSYSPSWTIVLSSP